MQQEQEVVEVYIIEDQKSKDDIKQMLVDALHCLEEDNMVAITVGFAAFEETGCRLQYLRCGDISVMKQMAEDQFIKTALLAKGI